MISIIFIHIGLTLPEHFFDSIYQSLLVNNYTCKHYILVDDIHVEHVKETLGNFNISLFSSSDNFYIHTIVNIVPLSLLQQTLENNKVFQRYSKVIEQYNLNSFRDGFWISTTARFYYIGTLMQIFNLNNCFHIENDIMMYETFLNIYEKTVKKDISKIWMVQDADTRVVPSILYFGTQEQLGNLLNWMTNELENSVSFTNDMELLGRYPDKNMFSIFPNGVLMYDGAAIGQYLGGIDPKNTKSNSGNAFNNPTIGFVNETCVFKPNSCTFSKVSYTVPDVICPIKGFICIDKFKEKQHVTPIANLHIHSKQLYKFSSVFDMDFDDIITGDRILSLCDFVITTRDIYNFHDKCDTFSKDVIIIKDWKNVNIDALNKYFRDCSIKEGKKTICLFVYTHILQLFSSCIVEHLDREFNYIIYTHNSDHSFDNTYSNLLAKPYITHVYAQNIEYSSEYSNKVSLLPIGIANQMWKHGNLYQLYTVMKDTYKSRKTRNLYVNINPNTYGYRRELLDKIVSTGCWKQSESKPYQDYLKELSQHFFCLCVRGNGIDTHRFWECLYLGVIPVIINNKSTNCNNFVEYLKPLQVPFMQITEDNLDKICEKYTESSFDVSLYKKIIKGKHFFYNEPALKLSYYKFEL
jgi:hypothetical protein